MKVAKTKAALQIDWKALEAELQSTEAVPNLDTEAHAVQQAQKEQVSLAKAAVQQLQKMKGQLKMAGMKWKYEGKDNKKLEVE